MLTDIAFDAVREVVGSGDFFLPQHQIIFQCLERVSERNEPFDPVTLMDDLHERGELDKAGGSAYVSNLATSTPSAANVVSYARIVKEDSILRGLITSANQIADMCYNDASSNLEEKINMAQQMVMEVGHIDRSKTDLVDFESATKAMINLVEERYDSDSSIIGVSSGFSDLDQVTSGLPKKDLLIIGGRPSMGKTSLALNMAESVAKDGHLTIVFSLEMDTESLMLRLYSNQANIPIKRLRNGNIEQEHWDSLAKTMTKIKDIPLFIDETPAMTPSQIRSRTRRIHRATGQPVGLIVIDYIQLMKATNKASSREAEISEISRNLKAIAKEFDCPVIALSQLNRGLEARSLDQRRPRMSDLRESGALEQDADTILFIYREAVYDSATHHPHRAEVIVGKQRNGELGTVYLQEELNYCRFLNIKPQDLPLNEPVQPEEQGGLDYE